MNPKPTDLPIERIRGNLLNRLQQANAQIRIWRALRVVGQRHENVEILNRYPLIIHTWPEALVTTFVTQLCSLLDRGKDCISVKCYEAKLNSLGKATDRSTSLLKAAEEAVHPLRIIRDNYYAHRLVEGAMTDLIKREGMSPDRLFEIYEIVRDAVKSLLATDGAVEFEECDPIPDLNRMICDLHAFNSRETFA